MPIYIQIPNVQGYCQDSAFKDQIKADSMSFTVSNPAAAYSPTRTQGSPYMSNMEFSKQYDLSSASIRQLILKTNGSALTDPVVVSITHGDGSSNAPIAKFELSGAMITDLQTEASSAGIIYEKFSINFTGFNETANVYDDNGSPAGNNSCTYDATKGVQSS